MNAQSWAGVGHLQVFQYCPGDGALVQRQGETPVPDRVSESRHHAHRPRWAVRSERGNAIADALEHEINLLFADAKAAHAETLDVVRQSRLRDFDLARK